MNDLEKYLESFLQKTVGNNFRSQNFILAVSGGVDSMVLVYIFHQLKLNITVAHVNYNLRGNDSVQDADLVIKFCDNNNIRCIIKNIENFKEKIPNRISLQMYARTIRYDFLQEIGSTYKNSHIVTAHHFGDSLETFFINFSRGSGLKGLTGISEQQNNIIRPLLAFTKEEIIFFAQKYNIVWREDTSNEKDDYTRNQIRHHITPKLKEISNNSWKNYQKSLAILQQYDLFFQEMYKNFKEKIIQKKNELLYISKTELLTNHSIFQYQLLSEFGFIHEKEQAKILISSVGSIFISEKFELNNDRNFFIIRQKTLFDISEIIIDHLPFTIEKLNCTIDLKFIENELHTHHFQIEKIQLPLVIRKRKNGDFLTKKNVGKVLLSKYLKDKKIPQFEKDKIWIITQNTNEVIGFIS